MCRTFNLVHMNVCYVVPYTADPFSAQHIFIIQPKNNNNINHKYGYISKLVRIPSIIKTIDNKNASYFNLARRRFFFFWLTKSYDVQMTREEMVHIF